MPNNMEYVRLEQTLSSFVEYGTSDLAYRCDN